jgi:hypothetical protein
LNSRLLPCQGSALPLSYVPVNLLAYQLFVRVSSGIELHGRTIELEAPNLKSQITNKLQAPNSKSQTFFDGDQVPLTY